MRDSWEGKEVVAHPIASARATRIGENEALRSHFGWSAQRGLPFFALRAPYLGAQRGRRRSPGGYWISFRDPNAAEVLIHLFSLEFLLCVCPRHTPNPSHKLQCSVGNPGIPYLFTANSARNPDGQIGARMNYFHGLGKAGLWVKKQASGTRVWVLGSAGGAAVRAAKNPAQQRRGLGSGIRRANYQPDSEN